MKKAKEADDKRKNAACQDFKIHFWNLCKEVPERDNTKAFDNIAKTLHE